MSKIRSVTLGLALAASTWGVASAAGSVKVFVLAGQSNMEGKAHNALFERQAEDEATREIFAHLRADHAWIVRDDVFIKFFERKGGLTLGFGSPGCTGLELELGTMLGDHFEEPVLLVKTAWGGHSLQKQFRPPSAGLPSDERLAAELARWRADVEERNTKEGRDDALPTIEDVRAEYGSSYRAMLAEVRDVLARPAELFPELAGKPCELAGFVWFQGWNDQYDGAELEYSTNMQHFIVDVRRDLGAAELPFVIGVMGQNGPDDAEGPMRMIQAAQLAMQALPQVKAVRTDVLYDEVAWKLYPSWKEQPAEWERTGSDHPYHYLGSAIWYGRIGRACGAALIESSEAAR